MYNVQFDPNTLKYDASEVVSKSSATEVLCYGTGVVVVPDKQ